MRITNEELIQIIKEELESVIDEKKGKKRKAAKKKRRKKKKKAKKKDACYRKVKARYKVWPSAYASGALVKCRKKGAKNWGNKSEGLNEELERKSPELEFYKNYAKNHPKGPLDLDAHKPQQMMDGSYVLPRFARDGNFKRIAEKELGKPYKTIQDEILKALGYSKMNEEFEKHDMYDPATGQKYFANTEQDHEEMAAKGYTHVDPNEIRKIIGDGEGGAAGMDPFLEKFGKDMEEEIIKTLEAMPDIGQHENGDYVMADDKEVDIVKERKKNCGCGQDPCKTYGRQ